MNYKNEPFANTLSGAHAASWLPMSKAHARTCESFSEARLPATERT